MIKMTRQQYQQTYGTTPTVEPIKMTRQQYAQTYGTQPSVQPEKKTWGGFAGNVLKSGGKLIGDTVSAVANVFNPNLEKNTIANIGRLSTGIAGHLDPTQGNKIVDKIPGLGLIQKKWGNQEDTATAVGQFYKDRYGGWENIKNTAYNDPVGMAADVGTVLTGVGGVIKGAGGVATKLGSVERASQLANAGSKLSELGMAVDPIMATAKGAGGLTSKLFSRVKPQALARADEMVTAGIGNPIRQANAEAKAGRSISSFIKEYNLFDRSPETAKQVVKSIGEKFDASAMQSGKRISTSQIVKAFDDKIAELSQANNGVIADATRQQIAELTRRKQMFLDSIVNNSSSPLDIGLDTVTDFRRKVIDPDVPKSEFGLNPRDAGKAGGVKSARDIFRKESIKVAPELEKLGLDYGMAKELEKILTSSEARKANRQLFNFTRMGGGGIGGIIAGAPGVIAGFTLEQIVNSPWFISTASEGLKKALNAKLNVPSGVKAGTGALYQTGRFGRMTNVNQTQSK